MLQDHGNTISRRAKLFALHHQVLTAGLTGARIRASHRRVLDAATAKDIQVKAIASLRNVPQENSR